jgi:hypothetical protein
MGIEEGDRQDMFDNKFLTYLFYAMFSLAFLMSFATLTGIAILVGWAVSQLL